jgi:hypothetical protein
MTVPPPRFPAALLVLLLAALAATGAHFLATHWASMKEALLFLGRALG